MFADAAAGAPGHRDAVAGGGVGVGGVPVDLAGAAGGQHHGRRRQRLDAAGRRCPARTRRSSAAASRRACRWREVIRSTAIQCSRSVMFGCARTFARAAPRGSRVPVASAAWAMRRSRGRLRASGAGPAGRSGSGENGTPWSTSHSIAAALCSTMKRAVCSSTRPAPASSVSRTCDRRCRRCRARRRCRPGPRRWRLRQVALGQHHHRPAPGQVQRHRQAGQAGADHDHRSIRLRRARLLWIANVADSARHRRHRCHAPTEQGWPVDTGTRSIVTKSRGVARPSPTL